ncbi:SU10 major capsid protein [Paenibacillus kobensis]|uniref:SU10 major capsid protein n=1 Tax=Paenibacillus kobensis TaxID=59841 RepID=UPI000FD830A2|nr:DUF5309 family protein [Paenibacillus kobensis]
MPQVQGVRGTGNILSAKMKIDMSEKIALLQPDKTPLTTILKRLQGKSETASNPEYNWMEDDLGARWDVVSNAGGYLSTDTTIVVANGDYFTANDLVKVPRTGEVLLITAIAANSLTVKRAHGTTAAAALVNNDPIVIIGNANEEGSGARSIKSTLEVVKTNYCQIFKTPFGVTNTQNASAMYGGPDLSYQQMKKGIEHSMDMARAFWFGELKKDTTGTHPKRSTKGIQSFLTSNNYDAGGTLTQANFDRNVSEIIFRYGSSEKIMFCSARVLSVINNWATGKLQIQQGEDTFGLAVTKYITPFGVLNLVYEPLFEGAVYGAQAAVIDVENIKYRPLKGRDTSLETNIQNNDEDQRKDQYITEAGIEVRLPKTHALITNVTG